MALNHNIEFPEIELGPDFAKDQVKTFKEHIEGGLSFTVISMPGVGVSHFLKYLSCQKWALFLYVDAYSLPNLTKYEFFKKLLLQLGGKNTPKEEDQLLTEAKKSLEILAESQEKIVIIFSRFDQLKKEFDKEFLTNIRSLVKVSPGKIVLIFTSVKPFNEIAPDALSGGNLGFYSENLYFKPYSKEDLKKLLSLSAYRKTDTAALEEKLKLSGGHNQLLHILINSQKQNFLHDQFVKLQMKDLINNLNNSQVRELQKIALGKKVSGVDEYLLGVGMVKESQLFTPLLKEYVTGNLPVKLPVKESKLFKLLRKNAGKIVTKDEIFAEVWAENPEKATDWALDALIYRLRRHPFIHAQGYIIESYKKQGYTLIT